MRPQCIRYQGNLYRRADVWPPAEEDLNTKTKEFNTLKQVAHIFSNMWTKFMRERGLTGRSTNVEVNLDSAAGDIACIAQEGVNNTLYGVSIYYFALFVRGRDLYVQIYYAGEQAPIKETTEAAQEAIVETRRIACNYREIVAELLVDAGTMNLFRIIDKLPTAAEA